MTTLVSDTDVAAPSPSPAPRKVRGSRADRWRASWRVSLRMAWRDARGHKGRSALVFVMVAIPVGLLVSITVFASSSQTDAVKALPRTMGAGVAVLTAPQQNGVVQSLDLGSFGTSDQPATAIPGYDADADGPANAGAIGRLVGGTAVAEGSASTRVVLGDLRRGMNVMVIDGSVGLGTKAELRSGRWASSAGEVVVTPYGLHRGVPSSGTITVDQNGTTTTLTVVGVANAYTSGGGWAYQPELVTTTPWEGLKVDSWSWVITGIEAVPWSQVRDLNQYGLSVLSKDALLNPPTSDQLAPEIADMSYSAASETAVLTAIGSVMLFAITVLLVAPAFAVSASRQRRTLALAASNGAETRQLRRQVLAQALVLGVLSTVLTAALALVSFFAFVQVWSRLRPWTTFYSFDAPVLPITLILTCAIASTVVAALLPASRLGRLDIVGVMRGQTVSPPLNRWLPVIGIVLATVGAVGIVWSVATAQRELPVVIAGLLLVIGPIMVVPALLVLAGRLASGLPVTPRMATRDAARHRTRATPTVAAIMGGTAALTIFAIALASDSEQQRREYTAQIPTGLGQYSVYSNDGSAIRDVEGQATAALQRAGVTGIDIAPLSRVVDPAGYYGGGQPSTEPVRFVAAVPAGCSVTQVLTEDQAGSDPLPSGEPGPPRCAVLGSNAYTNLGQILALPMSSIRQMMALDDAQLAVLEQGGVVAMSPRLGTSAEFITGGLTVDPQTGETSAPKVSTRATLAVTQIPATRESIGRLGPQAGALVSTETATRLGWPTTVDSVLMHADSGAIAESVESAVKETSDDLSYLYVERGFQRDDALIMGILFGGFALLLIIVTLISTSLALAEQQSDMGTFAAIGATRGTRRSLAAAQSAVVAVLGVGLGVVVGFFPGVALTYPLTSQSWDPVTGMSIEGADTILVVPWLPIAAIIIGVPLVAALLSAAAVRKAPTMTRRAE